MIFVTTSTVAIKASVERIFDLIRNVREWPQIFPPCRHVEILVDEPAYTKFYLTAVTRGVVNYWLSEQVIVEPQKLIRFRQLEPTWPFSFMEGEWSIAGEDGSVQLTMQHRFELCVNVLLQPLVGFVVKKIFVEKNTDVELRALVKAAEKSDCRIK